MKSVSYDATLSGPNVRNYTKQRQSSAFPSEFQPFPSRIYGHSESTRSTSPSFG